ncbi:MAG: carbonic anhydrase [Thermoanaerobaculia bacterium]
MNRVTPINSPNDIPPQYRGTPVARLIAYQNFGQPAEEQLPRAEILVGMCMDNRKKLRIPENFAFVLRSGGGNLRPSEFKVSYAIAVGGVRAIALFAHNHCGMVGISNRRQQFVDGLVDAGWDREVAEQHFEAFAPIFEIGNEIDFVLSEARRLRARYPKVLVAPLYYDVENNRLSCIEED